MKEKNKLFFALLWMSALCFLMTPWSNPQAGPETSPKKIIAPKIWDRKALSSWATPIAGINTTPTYYTEEEYYGAPINNLQTYPIYFPTLSLRGIWSGSRSKAHSQ